MNNKIVLESLFKKVVYFLKKVSPKVQTCPLVENSTFLKMIKKYNLSLKILNNSLYVKTNIKSFILISKYKLGKDSILLFMSPLLSQE